MKERPSVVPYSRVFINSGDPIEQEALVEFRLLYEGELKSSGNNTSRSPEKHAIRQKFHPQLRRLWQMHSGLRQLAVDSGHREFPSKTATEPERFNTGIAVIGKQWDRFGYQFIPLVTTEHAVRCSLDILMLRPGEDKFVFKQGDIDGQVKTLFDALRVPDTRGEVGGITPQHDETPFFCLLSDDKLITEVRVTSDELLLLPGHREVQANEAFCLIHVRLNYKRPGMFDRYLD